VLISNAFFLTNFIALRPQKIFAVSGICIVSQFEYIKLGIYES